MVKARMFALSLLFPAICSLFSHIIAFTLLMAPPQPILVFVDPRKKKKIKSIDLSAGCSIKIVFYPRSFIILPLARTAIGCTEISQPIGVTVHLPH